MTPESSGEDLADRPEQAEGGGDGGEREHDRDSRRDERSEGKEQDEQRDRNGQKLRPFEVMVPGPVSRVARREGTRLADRHLRMGRCGGEHVRARNPDRGRQRRRRVDHDRRVPVGRDPDLRYAAPGRLHARLHVREGRAKRGGVGPQRRAVDVAVLDGRRPDAVGAHQVVAACRLAHGAVGERLRAGRGSPDERQRHERNPARDRKPRMPRTPAPDRRDRVHRTT